MYFLHFCHSIVETGNKNLMEQQRCGHPMAIQTGVKIFLYWSVCLPW